MVAWPDVPLGKRSSWFDPLIGIALFKLLKSCLLVAAGVSALSLVHDPHPTSTLQKIAGELRVDPDNHWIHRAIAAVARLDARRLEELGVGTFVYAAVFAVEGGGLLLRKHWAEYLTVGVTASLVPFEIYELARQPSVLKVAGLVLNVAIVAFLSVRLRRRR